MSQTYSVDHYENFPVASLLLPKVMRRPIAIVYRFARSADDFADEGDLSNEARLALLEGYRAELGRLAAGAAPETALFRDLRDEVVQPFQVPLQLFYDLLDAFAQDVVKTRFADFGELMHYCRRSANPVGRIVLHIAGHAGTRQLAWSDGICAALQLINFWQDVAIDWQKGRVYLPQDELARFGVSEAQIAEGRVDERWRALMAFQVDRTRRMLRAGSPLGTYLKGRLGLEIRLTVLGGDAILKQLDASGYDMHRQRPKLRAAHWPMLLLRALFPRAIRS
ncbi:squalene synthase HpnC [Chitinimonas sp.]|uniref:squalene synthase HpnC n=1 Tax=Chitinimonas sp. TaxID=1934313 RepID=UPI002F941905